MINSSKIVESVKRLSDDRLETMVSEALEARMAEHECKMAFQQFDVKIRKEIDKPVFVDITVFGMADDTTKDEFQSMKNGKMEVVKGGEGFNLKLDDDSVASFTFAGVLNLNATDYLVTYRLNQ